MCRTADAQVHAAPVFEGVWPFHPLVTQLAALWDQQKAALAARAPRVSFVDVIVNVTHRGDAQRYWAQDGVHPNDEGYRVWAEHIGTSIVRQQLLASQR